MDRFDAEHPSVVSVRPVPWPKPRRKCRGSSQISCRSGGFLPDTSYSDPSLPLSVFVSCPSREERNRVERLAENVVHEALHLQLSLVERVQPLVIDGPDEEPVFSPWKDGWRTVRGLVHAVYVFGNLRCFWKGVASNRPESAPFAQARIRTIDTEMAGAAHLVRNRSLTAAGLRLATSILSSPSEA